MNPVQSKLRLLAISLLMITLCFFSSETYNVNANVYSNAYYTNDQVETDTYAIKVVKYGETFYIRGSLDSTNDIVIETHRNGSSNGSFRFYQAKLLTKSQSETEGEFFHDISDDITPINTFTAVGANHGYTSIVKITMSSHGKTTADLGSKYTDGTTTYTLLDIAGNVLTFGCPYTITDDVVSSSAVNPVATMTHVSGGTNTGNVTISTIASAPQLYPSTNNKSVVYVLDGVEITVDGTYYGNELQVQESYNVMDYKSIIDYAQTHIGTSYKNDSIEGVVRLSINYTFGKGANCLISHSYKALKKVTISKGGFLQAYVPKLTGYTVKRYIPGVVAKSGFDFANIVDMTTYNSDITFLTSDYINAAKPPNRLVDWLYDVANNKKVGFTFGYIVDKTDSKNSSRVANSTNAWRVRTTKKSYPTAMDNITLNPGDYRTVLGYRNYLSPIATEDATNFNVVQDKKDVYVYIDYHKSITAESLQLTDFIGKSITIVDSSNFTLLNDVVDSEGVTFSITGGYGYAILKLN